MSASAPWEDAPVAKPWLTAPEARSEPLSRAVPAGSSAGIVGGTVEGVEHLGRLFGEGANQGLAESTQALAQAPTAFSDHTLGSTPMAMFPGSHSAAPGVSPREAPIAAVAPQSPFEVSDLLSQPISKGWTNPGWWAAQIGHVLGGSAPALGAGAVGAVGGPLGAAGGFALESAIQQLAPAYAQARREGMDHAAAVHRAVEQSDIAGAYGAAMGVAPEVRALEAPIGNALLHVFGTIPALSAAQSVTEDITTGRKPSAERAVQAAATSAGLGAALVGGHAAIRALTPHEAPAEATPAESGTKAPAPPETRPEATQAFPEVSAVASAKARGAQTRAAVPSAVANDRGESIRLGQQYTIPDIGGSGTVVQLGRNTAHVRLANGELRQVGVDLLHPTPQAETPQRPAVEVAPTPPTAPATAAPIPEAAPNEIAAQGAAGKPTQGLTQRDIAALAPIEQRWAVLNREEAALTTSAGTTLEPTGALTRAFTPAGEAIESRYAAVPVESLIASHGETGTVNPEYPAELQPRDRSRVASSAQVAKIAGNLRPELLAESPSIAEGAPIVGPDRVVESGNARTLALRRAYQGGTATAYRDYLRAHAADFGLEPEDIERIAQPALVRVRQTPVNRAEFARQANQPAIAAMAPAEQARADAARLTDEDLASFAPDESGNVLARSNQHFVRTFLQRLGPEESAGLVNAEGEGNKRLADRIQSAVFAKVYGDDRLIGLQAEEADPEIRNVLHALQSAAPAFARARALAPDLGGLDIPRHIAAGAELLRQARRSGQSVDEFVNQADAFNPVDPNAARFAQFMARNARSAKRMGDGFQTVAQFLEGELRRRQSKDMFNAPPAGIGDILKAANDALEKRYGQEGKQAGELFGASGKPTTAAIAHRAATENRGEGGQSVGERRAAFGNAPAAGAAEEVTPLQSRLARTLRETDDEAQQAGYGQETGQRNLGGAARRAAHLLRRDQGSLLANGIAKDFEARKAVPLIGQRVSTPEDLAHLAQIYRDPRFETFRYFFTRGDKVVGQTGVTSRLPGTSAVFPGQGRPGFSEQGVIDEIHRQMRAVRADGFWLQHNHPSGDPTPSSADRRTTAWLARSVPGFRGHVVIDQDSYGEIVPGAQGLRVAVHRKVPLFSSYTTDKPLIPHPLLGAAIGSPRALAEVAKQAQVTPGYIVLIGRKGSEGRVSGIAELAPSELGPIPTEAHERWALKVAARVRQFGRQTGSIDVFAVNVPTEYAEPAARGILTNLFRDVILSDGQSLVNRGVNRWPGFEGGRQPVGYAAREETGDYHPEGNGEPPSDKTPPDEFKDVPAAARTVIGYATHLRDRARTLMHAVSEDLVRKVAPMASGTPTAQALAKDFANSMRLARWEWGRLDDHLRKHFTPEQRRRMWEALDEQSVAEQEGKPTEGIGLDRLTPEERTATEKLSQLSREAWSAAQDAGIVEGNALPSYVPRIVVLVGEDGSFERPKAQGPAPALDTIGRNLRTRTSQLEHRKHLSAAETEAAARRQFGETAQVVRDIRALPLATARLLEAVAGRNLVDEIKAVGDRTGAATVSEGGTPADSPYRFFTLDHPAFKTWRPRFTKEPVTETPQQPLTDTAGKVAFPGARTERLVPVRDAAGNIVFDKVPVYVRGDFEGPLKAVLSAPSGATYRALMSLKAAAMSMIMYSPLIHNAVEWGRAMPAMPGKVLTFKIYFEGNRAKNDAGTMREAINAGLDPIGHRFFKQDITSILEEPNLAPGRSWTAKLLGAIPGLFDKEAGQATRAAIDRMGDLWHNTLLWDRVGDLQAGLYVNFRDHLIAKGLRREDASRVAAHFANRYAGSLPLESMGDTSRKIANLLLFSRTYTLGNLGAMKDMLTGLPRDVQAQIQRGSGIKALRNVRSLARRKAIGIIATDVALMYAANSVLQDVVAHFRRDKSLGELARGYVDRLEALFQKGRENPLALLNPFADLEALSSTGQNEPGKEHRVLFGTDSQGTAVYIRNPVGKIGEEFEGFVRDPLEMFRRKLGTIARPTLELISNDRGYGRKVYDPYTDTPAGIVKNIGRVLWLYMGSQLPLDSIRAARNLMEGRGDVTVNAEKVAGPLAGLTFSRGAPGGPAVGQMWLTQDEHNFRVQEAMPAIREQIRAGNFAEAAQRMSALGVPPGLQRYYVATTLNPSIRLQGRALRNLIQYGTPAERQHMLEEISR